MKILHSLREEMKNFRLLAKYLRINSYISIGYGYAWICLKKQMGFHSFAGVLRLKVLIICAEFLVPDLSEIPLKPKKGREDFFLPPSFLIRTNLNLLIFG